MSQARKADERRQGVRKRARLRVRFWNEEIEGSGFTADISTGGLFLETGKKLTPRTRLHLEIELKSGSFYCEGVVARVLKASREVRPVIKPGVGIRFVGLLEAFHQLTAGPATNELEMDLRDPAKLATVYVRDIKRGGLYIPTDDPPAVDTTVTVRLVLPDPHPSIDARGVVIHVMSEPSGIGIQLLDIDDLRAQLGPIITE